MYKIYARRSTDFTGIDFLDDVEAIDTVDHTYAAVVKTANKPVVVYSSSGSVKSSNAQYRVDDWSSATAHTPPGITGLVLGACTPMTGVMLGVILVTSSMELYSILSMDQGATWDLPSASPIHGLTGASCPSAARILANEDGYGSASLVYIDPSTGFPAHKITRNLGVSWE